MPKTLSSNRKRLLLSAFVMNTGSHIRGGLWRHPEAEQHRFNELSLWQDLARQLEAAKFDALFLADVVGVYGNYGGNTDALIRKGLQVPSNDPLVLASALAATTDNLGLAITSSTIQAHPFTFARQLSTLDHLSGGRVAWNIVTSALKNAHRNFGAETIPEHDSRYDEAEEYLDVVYKLWEGSWEQNALKLDKEAGIFADPEGVRPINHRGQRYSVDGPHLVAPSPQRTPFLFQAGSSPRGTRFAARHAEATFIFAPNPAHAAKVSTRLGAAAADQGRRREDIKLFAGLSFTVGSTQDEAHRIYEREKEYLDLEAIIAHIGGSLGVDFGGVPLDTPLGEIHTEGSVGLLEAIADSVPGGNPTLEDLARYRAEAQHIVGSPEEIVDRLEEWVEAGVDGINIINSLLPGSYTDFIEHVLPILRERGLAQSDYAPGSLRQKITGNPHLTESHYGRSFRAPALSTPTAHHSSLTTTHP